LRGDKGSWGDVHAIDGREEEDGFDIVEEDAVDYRHRMPTGGDGG